MKKADPRLLLVVAMTVFGTLGLFVRNISVSSGELALYRAVLAALLIGVYLLVSRQKIPFARIKKEVPAAASLRCGDGRQLDPFI